MESLIKIAALCLTGAVLAAVLKKTSPEMALLLAIALCIGGLLFLARTAESAVTLLRGLLAQGGVDGSLFAPLVKTVGVAIVGKVGGELCRDAGESAAGYIVELAGAFSALLVSAPLWEAVWELLQGLV